MLDLKPSGWEINNKVTETPMISTEYKVEKWRESLVQWAEQRRFRCYTSCLGQLGQLDQSRRLAFRMHCPPSVQVYPVGQQCSMSLQHTAFRQDTQIKKKIRVRVTSLQRKHAGSEQSCFRLLSGFMEVDRQNMTSKLILSKFWS